MQSPERADEAIALLRAQIDGESCAHEALAGEISALRKKNTALREQRARAQQQNAGLKQLEQAKQRKAQLEGQREEMERRSAALDAAERAERLRGAQGLCLREKRELALAGKQAAD